MEEYYCITIVSQAGESEAGFAARLSQFWTHMLRARKEDFERVLAESTEMEEMDDTLCRQYLVEEDIINILEEELTTAGFDFDPVDREETYTRYEAAPPEWMQIEH